MGVGEGGLVMKRRGMPDQARVVFLEKELYRYTFNLSNISFADFEI